MANIKQSEREDRIKKLEELQKAGINPYPARSERTNTIKEILDKFKEGKKVVIVGRLMTMRSHGNLIFANLQDESEIMQIAISKKEIGDKDFKTISKLIDMGDFLQIEGECFKTHKGENSINVKKWKLLSKAIRPLPEKWHGIKDEEDRFRKRYLNLLMNKDLREMFRQKAMFWDVTRNFMKEKGFFEVETPTLELTTGGAEANPFITHHNDFDIDVYLRISVGELWQKRLMAAGFGKTFEIGRAYRNEGSSPEHLQEFTNMEFYWSYADYKDGMKLVQELYQRIATEVFGKTKFKTRGHEFDLSGEWETIDYRDEVKKQTGIDVLEATEEEMKKKLDELKVKYEGDNRERLTDTLWKYCRKNIAGPMFLINHPKLVSPLAKEKTDKPGLTERFQIIIAGSEIGNGYSELNDPIDQAKRFEEQKKLIEAGDNEAMMSDDEFVEMLEHGMPPTCGFGFGERLFSFMVDKTLREATLFPLMKPKGDARQTIANNKQTTGDVDLGITYEGAQKLVNKYIKEETTKLHLRESEVIMRALARHFGEDEEKWGIIGLLHDIDWDLTKEDIKNHTIKAKDILTEAGASQFLIDAVLSHTYGNQECGENQDKSRSTKLEYSLAAAETMTGLVIAAALVNPDKKLASVKVSSLKKKFKQKAFAANCNREIIKEIENTGLSLEEFFEISLKALQDISDELGL